MANCYSRSPDIVTRRVAGETVLVSLARRNPDTLRRAEVFVLNPSGEVLWEFLQSPRTIPDLAQKLREVFEIEEDRARADAQAFASALVEFDAVRVTDEE